MDLLNPSKANGAKHVLSQNALKTAAQAAADITAFNAQKDQPGGLKTLKAYRWSICAAAYDQNNG